MQGPPKSVLPGFMWGGSVSAASVQRCFSFVARGTLMRAWDRRHTPTTPPPQASSFSPCIEGLDGREVNPDRFAKAAQIRERPFALALAVPALCRMTK